jgi:acyl-CoA dehydrogenase
MLAGWLLGRAGIEIPDGPVAIAPTTAGGGPTVTRVGGAWRISGAAARVAWGRRVPHAAIVAPAPDGGCVVALIRAADWTAEPGDVLAREPRDTLTFAGPVAAAARMDMDPFDLRLAGAAARTQQIAGALAAIAATTVQYAQDRVQFGRPIGKFQAVQQSIATLAGQVAAARAAADIAAEAVGAPMRALPIAAGKARAGEAASIGAAIAHQVHGAIGFTFEHRLHFLTKRLWSWRDEFGNDSSWQKFLGRRLAQSGADAMWPTLTAA